jgi:hypothetical protein
MVGVGCFLALALGWLLALAFGWLSFSFRFVD